MTLQRVSRTTAMAAQQYQHHCRRWKHTVRIILLSDLPNGKGYAGDVVHVAAGYARNYLIPKKMALYAIPANFERLGKVDPDGATVEERRARRKERASMEEEETSEELKAADLLTRYLRNKMVSLRT
jgi:large subunit ribosomal protein L9